MREFVDISPTLWRDPGFQALLAEKILEELDDGSMTRREWETAIWREFIEKVADPGEKKFYDVLMVLFRGMEKDILGKMPKGKSVSKAKESDIEHWMFSGRQWKQRFAQQGGEVIEGVAVTAGSRAMDSIPVVGVGFDVTNPAVQNLLQARTIRFAKEVVGTTETQIRKRLATGIAAGEGMPTLRNRIKDYFEGDAIPNRAEMIARTETIWASNAGAEEAYVQSGVVSGKEFLTAEDERVCIFCKAAGERFGEEHGIKLGEAFYKLGDKISGHDSDLDRTATYEITYENVRFPPLHVRCRCTLIPVIDEKAVAKPFKPAKTLDEAEKWVKDKDLVDQIAYKNSRPKFWGGQLLSKKKKLEKFNIINSEIDRFQKDFNIKLPKISILHINKNRTGKASYSSNWKQRQITFAEEWTSKEWDNIENWEKKNKRRWDWIKDESHIKKNVRHEYAHIIDGDLKMISSSTKFEKVLKDIYKAGFHAHKISDYANSKRTEFFAEAFSQYTSPFYKKHLPKKLEKFFEEEVLDRIRR